MRTTCWSAHGERGRGHGRRETRAVRVLTVTDLGLAFPQAVHAARITRYRTNVKQAWLPTRS
jgi:hypothetical protein